MSDFGSAAPGTPDCASFQQGSGSAAAADADVEGPVCLTRSAPATEYSGQLMLYDKVDRSIIARSSVLQCIMESGGDTQLPDSVSLAEFNNWRRAGDVSVAAYGATVQAMDIRTICEVVKVPLSYCSLLPGSQGSSELLRIILHMYNEKRDDARAHESCSCVGRSISDR